MARFLALLCLDALLTGCQASGDTVIGRANGRDIVVTEAEIQKRIDDHGVSRAVALRELRREQETRAAIELQKKWKSSDNVYVEATKGRTRTDQPTSPNEAEIAEQIADEQKRRQEARAKSYEVTDESDEPLTEEGSKEDHLDDVVSRMAFPPQHADFAERSNSEGWQVLPSDRKAPQQRGQKRQVENNSKSQTE